MGMGWNSPEQRKPRAGAERSREQGPSGARRRRAGAELVAGEQGRRCRWPAGVERRSRHHRAGGKLHWRLGEVASRGGARRRRAVSGARGVTARGRSRAAGKGMRREREREGDALGRAMGYAAVIGPGRIL
jgi:hypothetical protein